MREITIDGRRIADDELKRIQDGLRPSRYYEPEMIRLLQIIAAEVRATNRLLENIAASMNENRSDDDA